MSDTTRDHEEMRALSERVPADGSIADLLESLRRIAEATPRNTNSATADSMASWTRAVAACAMERARSGALVPARSAGVGVTEDRHKLSDDPRSIAARLYEAIDNDHKATDQSDGFKRLLRHAAKMLNDLSAAPPDPTPDDGWRPISEGQRDGTVIVVRCGPTIDVAYLTDDPPFQSTWRHAGSAHRGRQLDYWPTHFRPLPAPPNNVEKSGAQKSRSSGSAPPARGEG